MPGDDLTGQLDSRLRLGVPGVIASLIILREDGWRVSVDILGNEKLQLFLFFSALVCLEVD